MSEGPVAGAGTAPTMPEGVIPYPGTVTESPEDVQAQRELFALVSQDAGTGNVGPGAVQSGQQGTSDQDPAAQLAHWKEMARKNEERARTNAEKAKQFDAYKQSQMTELEKANQRAEAAEKAAADALAERYRVTALTSNNLSLEFSDLLGSGTQQEINSRAERIASLVNNLADQKVNEMLSRNGNGQPQRQPGQRPVESLRPGSAPSTSATSPQNPDQLFRDMMSRGQ